MKSRAKQLSALLEIGDRLYLEGPMGVGKSSFARWVLEGLGKNLGIEQSFSGSPTFSIANEYLIEKKQVIHLDFYRIKQEREIEESGIHAYFWERNCLILTEWISNWPDFERAVYPSGRHLKVQLEYCQSASKERSLSFF